MFRVPLFAMQTPFTHVFLSSVLKLNEIEMRFLRKFFILHVGNEYSLVPEVYMLYYEHWLIQQNVMQEHRDRV